ncbi:hypothetical protein VPH35_048133 [Triticum aestivum]
MPRSPVCRAAPLMCALDADAVLFSAATAVGLRVHVRLQTYWMQSRIALSSALSGTTYGHRTTDQGLMTLIRQDTFCPLISPCCRWLLDCVMATLKTGHLWLSSCVIGGQRNQTKLA